MIIWGEVLVEFDKVCVYFECVLLDYVDHAMKKAVYEILSDDDTYYGHLPGFRGVYANAKNLETCRHELREVLEEWILIRLRRNLTLPVVKGINLNLKKVA